MYSFLNVVFFGKKIYNESNEITDHLDITHHLFVQHRVLKNNIYNIDTHTSLKQLFVLCFLHIIKVSYWFCRTNTDRVLLAGLVCSAEGVHVQASLLFTDVVWGGGVATHSIRLPIETSCNLSQSRPSVRTSPSSGILPHQDETSGPLQLSMGLRTRWLADGFLVSNLSS